MTIAVDIGRLLVRHHWSDVSLVVENGGESRVFKCHKLILAARSDYFANLLYGSMQESLESVVKIQERDLEAFSILIQFIYSDNEHFHPSFAVRVYYVSQKYAVHELQALCKIKLRKSYTVDTISVILSDFWQNHPELYQTAVDFASLQLNLPVVLGERNGVYVDKTIIIDVIKASFSEKNDQVDLFLFLLRWHRREDENKMTDDEFRNEMLPLVRFTRFRMKDVEKYVVRNKDIFGDLYTCMLEYFVSGKTVVPDVPDKFKVCFE